MGLLGFDGDGVLMLSLGYGMRCFLFLFCDGVCVTDAYDGELRARDEAEQDATEKTR